MKIQTLRVDQMYISLDDYKTSSTKLLTKLEALLKKFGQISPIIVWKNEESLYKIIDGGRVYIAAMNLGIEKLDVVVVDEDIDAVDADLLRVVYGQFKFDYDVIKLIELMQKVMGKYSISQLEELLPYNDEELNSYKALFNFDWNQFADGTNVVKAGKVPVKSKKMF